MSDIAHHLVDADRNPPASLLEQERHLPARNYSLISIICPTRLFAEFLKRKKLLIHYEDIVLWNFFFLLLAISMCFYFSGITEKLNQTRLYWLLPLFIALSRIIELLFAFYSDAFRSSSNNADVIFIDRVQRVKLLIAAYIEIIVQFGIVYYVISIFYKDEFCEKIKNVFDAIYFSTVTITTTGYGDILPNGNLSRSLVIVEALTGLLFIAGALALYVSRTEDE